MEDPEVFQGNFLFVNKNATNVKSRSPDEAFTIGSHVCGEYARWRRVARVKPGRITQFAHSGLPRTLRTSDDVNGEKDGAIKVNVEDFPNARSEETRTHWRNTPPPVLGTTRSVTGRSTKSSTSGTDEEAEAAQTSARFPGNYAPDSNAEAFMLTRTRTKQRCEVPDRSLWPSPRTILQKGNSDPFSAAALPISASISSLINVWQGVYLETVWPVDAGAASRTPALLSWQNDCRDAIADKARLHALLTWTLMLQISSLPESSNRSKLLLEYFAYKNKCLESLRWDLSHGASHLNMVPVLWHLVSCSVPSNHISV